MIWLTPATHLLQKLDESMTHIRHRPRQCLKAFCVLRTAEFTCKDKQTNSEVGQVLIIMERWGDQYLNSCVLCYVFSNPHHITLWRSSRQDFNPCVCCPKSVCTCCAAPSLACTFLFPQQGEQL